MPILKIQCNSSAKDSEAFIRETTILLSELLQKPEKFIMVILEDAEMLFSSDPAPCLYAELKSIGLPEERTEEFSNELCRFFSERLEIPPERMYIEFTSTKRHLLGWNGVTFAK